MTSRQVFFISIFARSHKTITVHRSVTNNDCALNVMSSATVTATVASTTVVTAMTATSAAGTLRAVSLCLSYIMDTWIVYLHVCKCCIK